MLSIWSCQTNSKQHIDNGSLNCETLQYGCQEYPVPPGEWKNLYPVELSFQTCDTCTTHKSIRNFESRQGSSEITLDKEDYLRILYYAADELIGYTKYKDEEKNDLFFYRKVPNSPLKAIIAYSIKHENNKMILQDILTKIIIRDDIFEKWITDQPVALDYSRDTISPDHFKASYASIFDTIMQSDYQESPSYGYKITYYKQQPYYEENQYPLARMCKLFYWSGDPEKANPNSKSLQLLCIPNMPIWDNYICEGKSNIDDFPEKELGLCFTHNDLCFFILQKF